VAKGNELHGYAVTCGEAYRIFDELPRAVRRALAESDYNWWPGYAAELVDVLGADGAVKQLALDDHYKHQSVARRERRTICATGGKRYSPI
jgi:hypothetical protein